MRSHMRILALIGFVMGLVALLAPTGFAATAGHPLEVETSNGIRYVSGGVGVSEQEALRAMDQDFNMQLIFATPHGNYLADVGVVIKDSAGNTVLNTVSQGPWFYAQLPAGTYTVTAQFEGQSVQRVVHVSPDHQTEMVLTMNAA